MADNVTLNSGSGGATMATDEVNTGLGNAHVQLIKLMDGTDGSTARIPGDATNGLDVDVTRLPALVASSALVGDVGIGKRTSGGPTKQRDINCGTTGVLVKASAGQIYWLHVTNTRTTPLYLKLYDKATAGLSSDTPVHTFVIPSQGTTNGAGFFLQVPGGIPFASGISYRVTTGIADADTGAPSSNEAVLNLGYN